MADRFYEILGIAKNATAEEINEAYIRKAKDNHPDVNYDPDAAGIFVQLNDAYDIIGLDGRRRGYKAIYDGAVTHGDAVEELQARMARQSVPVDERLRFSKNMGIIASRDLIRNRDRVYPSPWGNNPDFIFGVPVSANRRREHRIDTKKDAIHFTNDMHAPHPDFVWMYTVEGIGYDGIRYDGAGPMIFERNIIGQSVTHLGNEDSGGKEQHIEVKGHIQGEMKLEAKRGNVTVKQGVKGFGTDKTFIVADSILVEKGASGATFTALHGITIKGLVGPGQYEVENISGNIEADFSKASDKARFVIGGVELSAQQLRQSKGKLPGDRLFGSARNRETQEFTTAIAKLQRPLEAIVEAVQESTERNIAATEGGTAQIVGELKEVQAALMTQQSTAGSEAEPEQPFIHPAHKLTARQQEVLDCAAAGFSVQETATALGIVIDTVNDHRETICSKLRVKNVNEAVSEAFTLGLLPNKHFNELRSAG